MYKRFRQDVESALDRGDAGWVLGVRRGTSIAVDGKHLVVQGMLADEIEWEDQPMCVYSVSKDDAVRIVFLSDRQCLVCDDPNPRVVSWTFSNAPETEPESEDEPESQPDPKRPRTTWWCCKCECDKPIDSFSPAMWRKRHRKKEIYCLAHSSTSDFNRKVVIPHPGSEAEESEMEDSE